METVRPATRDISYSPPLLAIGSILFLAGYFLPWVTYHLEGGFLLSTGNGWGAVLGHEGIFNYAVGGANLSTAIGWILVLLLPFPLLTVLITLLLSLLHRIRLSNALLRIFWPCVLLGTLELLLTSYFLDPFGLNHASSQWALRGDPPPTAESGLFLAYVGWILIVFAGVLLTRASTRNSGNRS